MALGGGLRAAMGVRVPVKDVLTEVSRDLPRFRDRFGTGSILLHSELPRTQYKLIALHVFEYGRSAPGFLFGVLEELNAALF
jgi:hypothetical protein